MIDKLQDRYNLSPRQATALRQIARQPWSIETAQAKLQTTLGSLYHRGYIALRKRQFEITPRGEEALRMQAHAEVNRSHAQAEAPFARVIRELANYQGPLKVIPQREEPLHAKSA